MELEGEDVGARLLRATGGAGAPRRVSRISIKAAFRSPFIVGGPLTFLDSRIPDLQVDLLCLPSHLSRPMFCHLEAHRETLLLSLRLEGRLLVLGLELETGFRRMRCFTISFRV